MMRKTIGKNQANKQVESIDFVEKLEKNIYGAISFLTNYLITIFDLGFRQRTFSTKFRKDDSYYTKPLTLLIIQSFLTFRSFRMVAAMLFMLNLSTCRSCESSSESILPIQEPEILSDPLAFPRISEILYLGASMFIGILIIGLITHLLLTKKVMKLNSLFSKIIQYTFGFQFTAILIITPLSVVGLMSLPNNFISEDWSAIVIFLIVNIWPVIVFYRLIDKTGLMYIIWVRNTSIRKAFFILITFLMLLASTALGGLILYPLTIADKKLMEEEIPVINIHLISINDVRKTFSVIMVNNDKQDYWIKSDSIFYVTQNIQYNMKIIKGFTDVESSAFLLSPEIVRSFQFEVKEKSNSKRYLHGKMYFEAINTNGISKKIICQIRNNGGIYFNLPESMLTIN